MPKTKRAALYLRVSTDGQSVENQRLALEAVAQRGWSVVAAYDDNGISGAKGRDGRQGLDTLLKDATRAIRSASDRPSRSMAQTITTSKRGRWPASTCSSNSRRSTPRHRPAAGSSM